jgi:hypothetical protein
VRALEIGVMAIALALCSAQSLATPSRSSQPAVPSQPLSYSQLSPSLQPAAPSQLPPSPQPAQPSQPTQLSPSPQPAQPSLSPQLSQPAQSTLPLQPPSPAPSTPPRYSADGLYNLANSYARAGQPGLAVLNYERAALLAPYDADIAANLDYVRTSAHVPTAPPQSRFARMSKAVSPTLTAWLGVVGIALLGGALLANRVSRRMKWVTPAGVLVGAALIALPIANAMLLWQRLHEAVVLINQTPALVSPVPIADTAFVLPEAETVIMTAKHDDFVLVRTRGGLSGWVTSANLGAVVPEAN